MLLAVNQQYFVEFTISLRVQSRFFAHFPHLSFESSQNHMYAYFQQLYAYFIPNTQRSGFTAWAYCKVRKTILFCIFYPVKFCTFEDVLPPIKESFLCVFVVMVLLHFHRPTNTLPFFYTNTSKLLSSYFEKSLPTSRIRNTTHHP